MEDASSRSAGTTSRRKLRKSRMKAASSKNVRSAIPMNARAVAFFSVMLGVYTEIGIGVQSRLSDYQHERHSGLCGLLKLTADRLVNNFRLRAAW